MKLRPISTLLDRLITLRKQYIFTISLYADKTLPSVPLLDSSFRFIYPVNSDLEGIVTFENGKDERITIAEYARRGERLAVVLSGNEVACRGLVRTSGYISIEGDRKMRKMRQGEAFIHFCRTAEAHRGHSLYPIMLKGILSKLREDADINFVTINCRTDNVPSIKGIERAGFVLRQRAYTAGLIGGRWAITRLWAVSNDDVARRGA